MATYDSLTADEKQILSAWERNQRGWFNTVARTLMEARALTAAIDASGGPRDLITSLDADEVIPNSGGLAGAHSLTKQEWSSLVAVMDAFVLANDTPAVRELFAKAAGPTAGL